VAIEMLDPDAPGGTFTHWLAYGLSPGMSSLAAMPANAAEGVNDFGWHAGQPGRARALLNRARPLVTDPHVRADLDHVRGEKKFKVSEAVQKGYGIGFDRLLEEIKKCEVVCANCHRLRSERQNYGRRAA